MSDHDPDRPPSEAAGPIRWTQASWPTTPSSTAQSTIGQMTDQLQTVIAAAERAAEAIRRDAEEQARLHLAEAQRKADRLTAERVGLISELTDDLIRHATNVRDHSEQMVRALEEAIDSVTDKLEQPALNDRLGAAPPVDAAEAAAFSAPVPRPEPVAPPEQLTAPGPSGAYTDIVGAPPPPPPAWAPAPVPPRSPLADHGAVTGSPQPTPEAAAAAAAAGTAFGRPGDTPATSPPEPGSHGDEHARIESAPAPPLTGPEAGEPEPLPGAVEHARRLVDAGVDHETIADILRQLWGVGDPAPIIERVLGERRA